MSCVTCITYKDTEEASSNSHECFMEMSSGVTGMIYGNVMAVIVLAWRVRSTSRGVCATKTASRVCLAGDSKKAAIRRLAAMRVFLAWIFDNVSTCNMEKSV